MERFKQDDADETKFISVFEEIFRRTKQASESYSQNATTSPELGRAIYDEKVLPLYTMLSRALFAKIYYKIIDSQINIGTIDGYLTILYALFGDDAEIVIDKTNILSFDIKSNQRAKYRWKAKSGAKMKAKNGGGLYFKSLLENITNKDLKKLLSQTANNGAFLSFTINGK